MKNSGTITTFLIALIVLFSSGFACEFSSGGSDSGTPAPSASSTPAASSSPAASAPKDIAGKYDVTGTNEGGGGNYKGALEIIERGDVYQFKWDAGKQYDGVGVRTDNTIAVAFSEGSDGSGCGVILYKIGADGSLDGKAGYWGKNSSETEKATRTKGTGLDGEYSITGKNPDGKEYKGSLVIAPQGSGYSFEWTAGNTFQGFGVKTGDKAAVGLGGKQCGFVSYEIASDGTLNGKWGSVGSTSVGTETAKKK